MKADNNLAVENDLETKKPRHILQLSCGLTCELMLDEKTGQALCIWSERLTPELLPTVLREYPRWRDEILEAWWLRRGETSVSIPTPRMAIRQQKHSRSKSTSKFFNFTMTLFAPSRESSIPQLVVAFPGETARRFFSQ